MKFSLILLLIPIIFGMRSDGIKHEENEIISLLIPAEERKMQAGEDITYVVRYTFIKLGEVRLRVINKVEIEGKEYYNAIANIDSYSGIPFVNLHQVYESKVNKNSFSNFFKGIVKHPEFTTFTEYNFDYSKKVLSVKKGKVNPYEIWTDSTTSAEKMYQDGLSIFYYARMNTGTIKSVNLPCFVNEEKVYTKINFYDKIMPVEIDAIDYPVECVRLDGETDFVSVYGLTGRFEGWFSNDEAAIPIKANMKVIIGNVTLELVKWKKTGWTPPKYKN